MLQVTAFIPTYFAATIAISLLTALLVVVSAIRHQRTEYLSLSLLCTFISVFQFSTWQYHTSLNLPDAVYWLKMQTSLIILILPVYFFTFSAWIKQKNRNFWGILLVIVAIVMIAINIMSDFSVRFSSVTQLRTFEIWTGETVSVIKGDSSYQARFVYALGLFVLCALIFFIKPLFVSGEKNIAIVLSITIVGQILSVILGIMIDSGKINFIYLTAIPIIFLNVSICTIGAYYLRTHSQRYDNLHRKTTALENSISELAKGNSFSNSKEFYQHMLLSLYNLTQVEYVFIGLKEKIGDQHTIATKAAFKDGKIVKNFSYNLADTPCENVQNNKVCVYSQDVAEAFPHDPMLVKMQIEAYLGAPLLGENGELIGILTLLDTKPFTLSNQMIEAVEIFASRAAAELRRDQVEAKLRRLAYVDYTTGLANKARSFEVINETLLSRELDNENALLMLIDIDGFSAINHNFGYDVGEQILRELGQRLTQYQHENIFIARNGGDEFSVVFQRISGQPVSYMKVHWEAIRAVLRKPIKIEEQMIQLEFSMGAVIFPQQTGRSFDVIQCAETALLESKTKRKGGASLFEPELLKIQERYQFIDTQLRLALKHDHQLRMVYQPKTLANGEMIGIEALLRWRHPIQGEISPDEFISVAERSPLIIELGSWVVAQVCQQIAVWKQQGFECKVAINIASAQLLKSDFIDLITTQLQKNKIPPTLIEIEITESGLLNDVERAATVLTELRVMGISVALDDFGTGYSSLSYLRELPVDVLKIDKSFIDKISDESSAELIRTIIAIGQQLNLSIVAEGTEYSEQVARLSQMGCRLFQGYYFSKPIEAADVCKWQFANITVVPA
jgi:diguanylate cyclase (GGDEF)-like protein